ncbi:hypothetical protein VTG60DRAFT_4591 [Thermothelomyces hinnuleus]
MEYPQGDPRNGKPAESTEANEDNPAKNASEAPAYPSPISNDWKITGEGIKNAKTYWKLVYANQRQRRSRAKKRKDYGGADDQGRTKRRQGVGSSAPLQFQSQSSDPPATADPDDEYEPATAGVEHDVLAPVTILARLDKAEQMQLVKTNVDLNDPLALRDLQELHEAVVSFGHGNCRFVDGKWELHGFGTSLYHHQKFLEFFTYLDFITSKFSRFGDYQDLMGDVVDEEQQERLRATFQGLTLMRRVGDELMGRPILQIPKSRPTELITVEFSPLEASMHQPTKDRLQQLREHSETRKGADRSLAVPSGELRRLFNYLRYFPSHPALVEPTYLSRQPRQPNDQDNTDPQVGTGLPITPKVQYFCRACRNALVSPLIAEFRELTKRYVSTATPQDDKRMKRVRKPGDDEFGLQPRLARGKKTKKGGKRRNKAKSGTKRSSQRAKSKRNNEIEQIRTNAGVFLKECDARPWDPIPHSAKSRATMDLIAKWQDEAPDDKIIVFVQWIPMISILGGMLFQNGFRFVYLWGEMEPDEQERCIRAFEQIADIKVMLISVSCGAHGLNLTVANRAIVFDHWWHEGWERQAFARIHRIGQTKEVHTAKLVVKGSMEETVMTIQASKREAIRTAGSESDGETGTETEVESCSDDGDSDDEEDEREFDTDNTTSSGSDEEYVASSTGTHRAEDEDDLNTDGDGAASKEL